MLKGILYFGLILTISRYLVNAVEITKFTVPNSYVLSEDNPKKLVLDCEYQTSPNETGLVVKWLLDEINIYQWIPNQKPYSLGPMKKHIDTSFSPSQNKYDQHRAISISDPKWNMTGNYTCSVQTFQGIAQKTAELKIIHPETDFTLNAQIDKEGDDLDITCSVDDVFPPPNLAILVNGVQLSIDMKAEKDTKGPFDVIGTSKKALDEIESPATITCILTIPGTDYEKQIDTDFSAPVDDVDIIGNNEKLDGEENANLEATSEEISVSSSSYRQHYWTFLHSGIFVIAAMAHC